MFDVDRSFCARQTRDADTASSVSHVLTAGFFSRVSNVARGDLKASKRTADFPRSRRLDRVRRNDPPRRVRTNPARVSSDVNPTNVPRGLFARTEQKRTTCTFCARCRRPPRPPEVSSHPAACGVSPRADAPCRRAVRIRPRRSRLAPRFVAFRCAWCGTREPPPLQCR